jgi:Ca2+-binding EF-hand superfamily protein
VARAERREIAAKKKGARKAEALTESALAGESTIEELRKLFDSLDKDGDGNVTSQEWGKKVRENQALLSKYFGGSTLKEIGSAFRRIDADGNASLSWEEFIAAAGLARPVVQPGKGGGQSEEQMRAEATATIDAGIQLAKEAAKRKGVEELRILFDTLDADGDGNVTSQEWGKKVKENQALLSKYFGGSTLKEIGSAFRRIDADGKPRSPGRNSSPRRDYRLPRRCPAKQEELWRSAAVPKLRRRSTPAFSSRKRRR